MKIQSLLSTCLTLVILSSCGKNSTPVKNLPEELKNGINQNLQNGVIPSQEQVHQGDVPKAVDECAEFRKKIPADWFQEKLEVPEDPAAPEGRKINVFYYGKIFPGSIPTIFFNGGPGSDSHGSATMLTKRRPDHDKENKISFIYIDQRGTGCSDYYPQMKDNDKPDMETLNRMRFYGSSGIVADSEAVRAKVMGNKKWNVFGQSYGAFIVHRYAVNAAIGVNAALAHANTLQADGFERIKFRLASQARVFADYLKEYPDDVARFTELSKYFSLDRCYHSEDKKEQICGAEVLEVFSQLLGFHTQWKSMHSWVKGMYPVDQVNEGAINEFLAAFYFSDNSNPLNVVAYAFAVINYTDRNVPAMNSYNCYRAQQELLRDAKVDLNTVYISECAANLQTVTEKKPDFSKAPEVSALQKMVNTIPKDLLTVEKFAEGLKASPEMPFYLFSGEKDSFVPVANFQEELKVVKDIPNLHYTDFPGSGHDGFYSEEKVWTDLLRHSQAQPL